MSSHVKPATVTDNTFSSPYDELNRRIVGSLQQDSCVSFRTIADTLDVSEGTVHNRVNCHVKQLSPR